VAILHILANDRYAGSDAADAFGGLGASAATPEILEALRRLLADGDPAARCDAARAVGGLGTAAAKPEFLGTIARLLADAQSYVRAAAARAVCGLGVAAATPEFLASLTRLLADDDGHVREAAAQWTEVGEQALPVRSEAAAPEIRNTFFRLRAISWTASATLEFGTSTIASTPSLSNHRLAIVGSAVVTAVGAAPLSAARPLP
jgi:hypothetical protein